MKQRLFAAIAILALALLAGCDGDTEATPTLEVTTTASATSTVAATPTSVASSAPQRTASSSRDILFCDATRDSLRGVVRYSGPAPSECDEGGFLLRTGLPATVADGDFVPRCLQPVRGEGATILVGRLCVTADSPPAFTSDPRPAALADQLADGDLIPICRASIGDSGEVELRVGPPCILDGEGSGSLITDRAAVEVQAICGAGLFYFQQSAAWAMELLSVLPAPDEAPPFEDYRTEVESVRANAPAEPGELVRSSFDWADNRSPILMNAAIVEALDALEADDSPEAVAALRAQINDAIDWYTAGRGC